MPLKCLDCLTDLSVASFKKPAISQSHFQLTISKHKWTLAWTSFCADPTVSHANEAPARTKLPKVSWMPTSCGVEAQEVWKKPCNIWVVCLKRRIIATAYCLPQESWPKSFLLNWLPLLSQGLVPIQQANCIQMLAFKPTTTSRQCHWPDANGFCRVEQIECFFFFCIQKNTDL